MNLKIFAYIKNLKRNGVALQTRFVYKGIFLYHNSVATISKYSSRLIAILKNVPTFAQLLRSKGAMSDTENRLPPWSVKWMCLTASIKVIHARQSTYFELARRLESWREKLEVANPGAGLEGLYEVIQNSHCDLNQIML